MGRIRNEGCSHDVICLAEMHRLLPCLRDRFCWLQTVWASRPKCAKFWFRFIFWRSLSCKMGTLQKTLKICKVGILIHTQLNVIHIFVGEMSWICPLPRFPKALRAGTPMCFSCQLEFLLSSLFRPAPRHLWAIKPLWVAEADIWMPRFPCQDSVSKRIWK